MREEAEDRHHHAVDPGELALILLNNAARLLDQSAAPAEIRAQLREVIGELEELIAGRR